MDPNKISLNSQISRFLYLNKAGFNGMYRVNLSGKFNVPFGSKEKVNVLNKTNINKIKKYLEEANVVAYSSNYKESLKNAKKGDFVFVDPPYDGDSFTAYDSSSFGKKEQEELAQTLSDLDKKGVKWLTTNHNTDLIKYLYKEYNSFVLNADRYINPNSKKRQNAAREIFISNYKINLNKNEIEIFNYFSSILSTNNRLKDFTEWNKIENKLKEAEFALNQLQYLVGSKTNYELKTKVKYLYEKSGHEPFSYLELLVARRDDGTIKEYFDDETLTSVEYSLTNLKDINKFIVQTKLLNVFNSINSLKDYVFGIEVGLDSNARKNRTGKIMEKTIAKILTDENIVFEEQIKLEKLNVKSNEHKANKLLDFYFTLNEEKYVVESSFYNGQGSKINETLKSYVTLSQDVKKHKLNLIWVADGAGMKTIKNHLIDKWEDVTIMSISQFKKFLKTSK